MRVSKMNGLRGAQFSRGLGFRDDLQDFCSFKVLCRSDMQLSIS